MKWIIDIRRTIWSAGFEVYIGGKDYDGIFSIAKPMVLERLEKDQIGAIRLPFATIPMDAAQSMIDALWHAGIRPTEGSGSAGSLAATERHLADIKAIAFHALKITNLTKAKNDI